MKTIGFVDYYLSEWHANNYPTWMRDVADQVNTEFKVAYGWAELDVSPVDGVTSAEWCEKNGVELCSSLEELCEKSDYIVILAPSDPDKHLPYARVALTYGKPTYIDKTFAPNSAEAKEIFELGKKYGAKFFSTSALRYGDELKELGDMQTIIVTGGGSNLPEYIVHIAEIAVSVLKDASAKVMMEHKSKERFCTVKTASGKTATLIYTSHHPYSVAGEDVNGKEYFKNIKSSFFKSLMADILRFFESNGEFVPFDPAETLEVMRLRDAILAADEKPGEWIEV